MPARRGATTAGLVLHHSGIHAALGASVADASQEIDLRLKWMAIEGQMEMSEAQRISDEQPHARSLCALADRIAGGEEVFVSPWRVIHLLVTPEHDGCADERPRGGGSPRMAKDHVPEPRSCPSPAVVVSAGDIVRPAPFGTVASW